MSKEMLGRLWENWFQVIKLIYPDMSYIPRGEAKSLDALFFSWHENVLGKVKPSEAVLLAALALVELRESELNQQKSDLRSSLVLLVGETLNDFFLTQNGNILLLALLVRIGAVGKDLTLAPIEDWFD